MIVSNNAGPLELLSERSRNQEATGSACASLGPSGGDALGAEVIIEAEGKKYLRRARSGGSYSSAGDPRVHFGLGAASTIGNIEVAWPDGKKENFSASGIDRYLTLRQGQGRNQP